MNRFSIQLRSEVVGNTVTGVAAVFDTMADLGRGGYEVLARTAFDSVLKTNPDVRALVNHDPGQLLGRTGNGSLELRTSDAGLEFSLQLPSTQLGTDVGEMVRTGLLNQMSFGFIPGEDSFSRAPDGKQVRTHISVQKLMDVSLVAFPAYDGTSAELRSLDSFTFDTPPLPVKLITAKARLLLMENK